MVSRCRTDRDGLTGFQELRIRRRGCDPVTVVRFETTAPVHDMFELCRRVSLNRNGSFSPLAGVFQRLGVSRDGSAVVFEVTNQFQLTGRYALPSEQQGFFVVRSDGTGLRRLGPASSVPPWVLFPLPDGNVSAGVGTSIAFSPSGRRIAYVDLGQDQAGARVPVLYTLDLSTGTRVQITRSAVPGVPGLVWVDERRLLFTAWLTPTVPSVLKVFEVRIDDPARTAILEPDIPVSGIAGPAAFNFGITGANAYVVTQIVEGVPENAYAYYETTTLELFRFDRKQRLQLTNFHRNDTVPVHQVGSAMRRIIFVASADPVGENPEHNCQVFSMSGFGARVRQLTHFGTGVPSQDGCQLYETAGCGIRGVPLEVLSSPTTLFYSDCDPLGTNANGTEIFSLDVNTRRLHQITETAGVVTSTTDVVETELPGPVAQSPPRPRGEL